MHVSKPLSNKYHKYMNTHYSPFLPAKGGEWSFTTPTGQLDGFPTRANGMQSAASTERDDRSVSESTMEKVATKLRKHFGITREKASA
jgi:hypothetical protein